MTTTEQHGRASAGPVLSSSLTVSGHLGFGDDAEPAVPGRWDHRIRTITGLTTPLDGRRWSSVILPVIVTASFAPRRSAVGSGMGAVT
jgi:hypothetical protein